MTNAQAVVDEGLKDIGYEYVVVDDCWQAATRDANGRLQEDRTKFPDGLKNLTDEVSRFAKGQDFRDGF